MIYYVDETVDPGDASTLVDSALDAGATDVVEAHDGGDRVSLLAHRVANGVEAARAAAEAERQR
mgnify:CR=1 FL=1